MSESTEASVGDEDDGLEGHWVGPFPVGHRGVLM